MMARHNTHKTVVCTARLAFSNTHGAQSRQRPAQRTRSEPAQRNACSEQHPVPQDVNDLVYDACCSCFTFKNTIS